MAGRPIHKLKIGAVGVARVAAGFAGNFLAESGEQGSYLCRSVLWNGSFVKDGDRADQPDAVGEKYAVAIWQFVGVQD